MNFVTKSFTALSLCCVALFAQAGVVNTLDDATAIVLTSVPGNGKTKQIAPGISVKFTTAGSGTFAHTGSYGFSGNGMWSGIPMLGTNSRTGYFDITFKDAISGFLGEVNWTKSAAYDASMAIYGVNDQLLETLVLEQNGVNLVAASKYYGFSRQTADIKTIRFTNEFIGARNMSYSRAADVPEPGSLALLGLALAGIALARRRS